jgi:acyl-CoA thioesterase FadM
MSALSFSPTPSSLLTIRFQDCDPFNHLNNGRYVDYFLNAREDHLLEHYGLDIYKIARETGLCWVVSTSQIAYLRPAITMEKVLIETRLISYAPKHVAVEMRMWDEGRRALKAFCWMGFVHFDLRSNSVKEHSADYTALFARVHQPVPEKSFEERLAALKKNGAEV